MLTHECDYISKKNFKIVPVVDICKISLGGTPSTRIKEFWGGKIQWATAKDIVSTHERFISATERTITQLAIAKSNAKIFPEKTIVITSRGTVGAIALLGIPMAFNQTCYGLNPNEKNDPLYIYYALKNSLDKMLSLSYGTVFQTITMKTFSELKIPVPSVSEQQSIAKILSDLDEKIELNNEMNKTLEEIPQAIFKRWFIDFEFPNENGDPYKSSGGEMVESELGMIPKGWDIGIFSDLCVLTMGLSPKGAFYNSSNEGYPLLNGATDFQNGVISPTKYTSKSTRLCKRGELLICVRGTIGNLTYADKEYCLGRGVASVSVKEEIFREYIFFKLKEKINHLISQASGSVILGLSKPDIENIRIIVPPKNIVSDYHKISFDIFLEKSLVTEENTKLSKIRDLLLPKLMTGRIRVPLED